MTPLGWLGRKTSTQTKYFPVMLLLFFTGTFIATPSPEKKIAYKTFFVLKKRLAIIGRLLCLVAQILLLTLMTGSK